MFEITVSANLNNLSSVLDFVEAHMPGTDIDMLQQNNIAIVVEEVFVNIASYAYPDGNGDVTIRLSAEPDKIALEFTDSGRPYNPLSKEDPDTTLSAEEREIGGLGIYLVKKMMDCVKYRYEDNKNILYMEKRQNTQKRGKRIVFEKLIEPFFNREARYIGVELEYPVIPNGGGDIRETSPGFLDYLINEHGFEEHVRGSNGQLVRVKSPDNDLVGFELHYGHIEFAMQRNESLRKIAERFYRLYKLALEYFKARGFIITGMGTNLKTDFDNLAYVTDDFTRFIREFLSGYTYFKKDNCLVMNMFSTQTHVEIAGERLLDTINLLSRLDFVKGLLFSNSLPHPGTLPLGKNYPEGTLCARDFNWKYSDHPAAGCFDNEFKNTDELADYITGLEFIFGRKDGKVVPIDRITVGRYFDNPGNSEEDFSLFRMFSHTALTHYHTLEIRDDCTQPVSDAFAACAFNIGIIYNIDAAMALTQEFFHDNGISASNSALREMSVTGQTIAPDSIMKKFLRQLYDISHQGLLRRGFGEEIFIQCLAKRIETLSCPAKDMLELLEKGVSLDEIMRRYGQLDEAPL